MSIPSRVSAAAVTGFFLISSLQAQTVTSTKVDTFTPDGMGRATPGNPIDYTITISDGGGVDATGVVFTDPTPANTTLVGSSVNVSPLAFDEAYTAIGNTLLRVGGAAGAGPEKFLPGSVTANDTEFLGDAFTISTFMAASAQGGTVNVAADGSFTYLPPAGFIGTDTFTYTLRDDGTDAVAGNADDLTNTGTVTITVANKVWYVDSTAPAGGDGRSTNPFDALADLSPGGPDGVGDIIYVRERAGDYDGNLALIGNQQVLGSGVALVVGGVTLLPASTNTTWVTTAAATNAITLSSGNTVRGLSIGNTTGTDIIGTVAGALTINTVTLSGTGQAFVIGTSGTLDVTIDSLSASSGTSGVSLTGCNGSFTANGGSINGPTGTDFAINGGTANVTYNGTITNSAGNAVNVTGKTGGTVIFNGRITDTGGGIALSSNTGATINFKSVGLTTAANNGFSATGGGTVSLTDGTADALDNDGDSTTDESDEANTITTTTGTALNVTNTTIAASGLTFRSISANGAVNGIVLNNTGANAGLTVTGNSSGLGGGSVTVNPVGTPATVTAPVTADLTGGTIQNTTGSGILLNTSRDVSLTRMWVKGSGADGIGGTNVTNFTLASSFLENNGNAVGEASLNFGGVSTPAPDGLHGTGGITNSTIQGSFENVAIIRNFNGAPLTSFGVTGSQFRNLSANVSSDDGFRMEASGTAVMAVDVQNSFFGANRGDHFQVTGANSGSLNVKFKNNTLAGGHATALGGGITINAPTPVPGWMGTINYDIDSNTISGAVSSSINVNLGTSGPAGLFNGFVRNNVVGTVAVADSGSAQASGIQIEAHGNGTHTSAVTNNIVRQAFDRGLSVLANDGSGVLNLTVTGNNLSVGTNVLGSREAFFLNNGSTATNVFGVPDKHTVRLDLGGAGALANTLAHGVGAADDFRVRQRFQSRIEMPGYAGGAFDTVAVVTYIRGRNTGSAGEPGSATINNDAGVATDGFHAGAVPLPSAFLTFAPGSVESIREDSASSLSWTHQADALVTRAQPGRTVPPWGRRLAGEESASSLSSTHQPDAPVTRGQPGRTVLPSEVLTQAQLEGIVSAARARWEATGLSPEQIRALRALKFEAAALPGWFLGEATAHSIRVDTDAGGNRWFIDATPFEDGEFAASAPPSPPSPRRFNGPAAMPAGRIDLLTTVMHEMGHALGLCDTYSPLLRHSVMHGFLGLGERRVPIKGEAAGAVPHGHVVSHFLSAPINIGTLPSGKTITIVYRTTINPGIIAPQVSNQGTVTGSNFAAVMTDDPSVGGAADPTVTPVEVPPVVSNVARSVAEDAVLTFAAADFTAAYSDANTDVLAVVRVTSLPASGTLKLGAVDVAVNQDIPIAMVGSLTYAPANNFNGADSFGWNGSDGTVFATTPASVNLTVTPVNDNPVAGADAVERYPTQSVKIPIASLLANDTDVDGDTPLALTGVSAASANGGTVSHDATTVFYTPAAGFLTADSFTYTLDDGHGGTATGTVTVAIKVENVPADNVTKIEILPDGSRRLTFAGIPGRTYRVQSTDTLAPASWTDRVTVTADAQGRFQFTDPPPLPPERFYRTINP